MELKHIAKKGGRLSSVLREEMGMSMSLMNKLKWKERLLVNGVPCHTDYPVKPGDRVCALLPEAEIAYPAEFAPIDILYEDDHLLAVDKPAGMLIHPSRAMMTGTLANRVQGHYQKTGQNCVFHPITRLDRDTFGVVLIAKNAHIHRLLQGKLQKTYYALVWGGPQQDAGAIDAPIARREKPSLLRYVSPEGKPSLTEYKVLHRGQMGCLMALSPITGRTHQLRVHCAHMGFPILGDPQYGSEESRAFSYKLGLSTQALCAARLNLSHPITGKDLEIFSKMGEMLVYNGNNL